MKVLVLMASDSPWSQRIVTGLCESGNRVWTVVVTDSDATAPVFYHAERTPSESSGVAHSVSVSTRWSGLRVAQLAGVLRRTARRCRPDIVLALYGGAFGLAALLSGLRPYSVYVVGSDVQCVRGVRRALTRVSLEAAELVLVNGDHLAARTREVAPGARVRPLLMGVDTTAFAPVEKADRPIRIVCTRAFKPIYDNETIVEAARLMGRGAVDVSLSFTAGGPLLARARRTAAEALPPGEGVRLEFLGGVPDEALRECVRRAHIYVSMARSDGTSTSLLEAMACGAFPVVTDIPQNREWIDGNQGNGILVPPGSAADLAHALQVAVGDAARRDRAAGPNRARVVTRACSRTNLRELAIALAAAAGGR